MSGMSSARVADMSTSTTLSGGRTAQMEAKRLRWADKSVHHQDKLQEHQRLAIEIIRRLNR